MKTKTPIFPQRKKAFTLVELIIVITILAILATIAFVSFQGYSAQSRDSNRVATVKNIENGVNIFITKTGKVPEPDDVIGSGKLTSSGPVLNIVGKVGAGITRSININTLPLDPRAQEQYWYGVDTLRRYFQVGLTLESETAYTPGILPSYAGNILEAKVQGNYEYPLKLENIVYSLPSLLFLGSGGVLNNQTEFVVDEGNNVPYTFGQAKSGTQSVSEVLKIITGTGNLSLTGVSLPTMTMSDYKSSTGSEIPNAFSGVAQLLGITDKNKLGVVVYGKDFVGVGVSGVWEKESVGNNENEELGPPLLAGPFINIDGSYTSYIPDGTDGEGRFTLVSGTVGNGGSGVVRDNITGLYWMSDGSVAGTKTWTGAKDYCAGLSLGGFDDWRLSDYTELKSIVDFSRYNPTINTSYFSSISNYYWVSNIQSNDNLRARMISFNSGNSTYTIKTNTYNIRCVRGNKSKKLPWQGTANGYFDSNHNVGDSYQPDSRFSLVSGSVGNGGSGVVFDSVTGLHWMSDGNVTGTKTWTASIEYCSGLVLGGKDNWRLPTFKELESIVDLSTFAPTSDALYFTSAVDSPYWTINTYLSNSSIAYFIFFISGYSDPQNKTYNGYHVRCVY